MPPKCRHGDPYGGSLDCETERRNRPMMFGGMPQHFVLSPDRCLGITERSEANNQNKEVVMSSRSLVTLLSVIAMMSLCTGLAYPTYAAGSAESAPTTISKTPPASGAPVIFPVVLPGAIQFDMPSKITGRTYRIYVATPSDPPPRDGYPTVYLLDASLAFATVASQATIARADGRPATLVIGIGYPDDGATMLLRRRDLTPSEPTGPSRVAMVQSYGPIKPSDYGGAEAFHRFMMEELRPRITGLYRVNPHNQSLMGYSLGGLFVLHVLFEQPDAYRSYVVSSPSIWWNDKEVLRDEATIVSAIRAGKAVPRILITSNEWEQFKGAPGVQPDDLKEMKTERMVDNARELASRLQAIKGSAGYEVRYFLFLQETHISGAPAAASRGMAFLARRP